MPPLVDLPEADVPTRAVTRFMTGQNLDQTVEATHHKDDVLLTSAHPISTSVVEHSKQLHAEWQLKQEVVPATHPTASSAAPLITCDSSDEESANQERFPQLNLLAICDPPAP